MGSGDVHFEPFLHLAGLAHDRALVAWGGFFLQRDDAGWRVLGGDRLPIERRRGPGDGTIGADSPPYGPAVVEALRGERVVARAEVRDRNWAWLEGLEAATEHRYRVTVGGREWAAGERWDWDVATGGLAPSGRRYDNRFRTFPDPGATERVTFAVLGDFGTGILDGGADGRRQARVARALERAVDARGVALVLTVGDNVYLGDRDALVGTGRDGNWYASFYAPYRYVINRVPVFPAVGNHDTSDPDRSDDRDELDDNFFVEQRFRPDVGRGRASLDPGLFYRFDVGRTVGFVAVDTTCADDVGGYAQYFQEPRHARWLRESLMRDERPRWLIPFSHHPPYCAGPSHPNTQPMVDDLVPLFRDAGVRLVLSGHEHNFQHSRHDGIDYVISGAGGKLREEAPDGFARAHTRAWAAEGHFLLVDADEERIEIEPVGSVDGGGALCPIALAAPGGERVPTPLRVPRAPEG